MNKAKSQVFIKINKTDKFPARLNKKSRERKQINGIRNTHGVSPETL